MIFSAGAGVLVSMLSLGRGGTFSQALQLAKEFPRCLLVSGGLNQNIKDIAFLIHCAPEVMEGVDVEEYLIQVPLIACPRRTVSQAVCVRLTYLKIPFWDRLIAKLTPRIANISSTSQALGEAKI